MQATKLFGIIGNPVSHSRSPLIHNTAFQHIGFDGVYVPLLVDDLERFLYAFGAPEWGFQGFSVTIPHKVRGAQCHPHLHKGLRRNYYASIPAHI